MLISQRRGLFFKIPKEAEDDLHLWELTVFKFAGEYLDSVVAVLKDGGVVKRPLLSRIVRGLNRVLPECSSTATANSIGDERQLLAGESEPHISWSAYRSIRARERRWYCDTIPLNGRVLLTVFFAPTLSVDFPLTLIRYEFLSRIAMEGALPASFSKECYEDLLAFKSRLIAAHTERQAGDQTPTGAAIGLNLFALTDQGMPEPRFVEIVP